MKKRLLFIGIIMNSAGTEKSFLSFAESIDYTKYEIDLLLAKKTGAFMELIPPQVNVIELPEYGEFFLLSGKNAVKNIYDTFIKKHPGVFFKVLPYFIKSILFKKYRVKYAIKMWIDLSKKFMQETTGKYDAAIAFWGDRTMFYMIDKVPNATKKIAWMHFDYDMPPRDDEIYSEYFSKCDAVVNVSEAVDDILQKRLPTIAGKCVIINNIINENLIRKMSLTGPEYPDFQFNGIRILTVGRISIQKGIDFIPIIMANLKKAHKNVRWYIVGDGDEHEKAEIVNTIMKLGLVDDIILLGTTTNPYTYMRDCTIYVQPSRYEGKPIAVEEAKILRCPIVAANYLSAGEQLNNGKYGIIAEANAESLYKAVERMINEPELRNELSQNLANEVKGNCEEIEKFYSLLK